MASMRIVAQVSQEGGTGSSAFGWPVHVAGATRVLNFNADALKGSHPPDISVKTQLIGWHQNQRRNAAHKNNEAFPAFVCFSCFALHLAGKRSYAMTRTESSHS